LRIFIAESLGNHTEIELVSGKVGLFQEAINQKLFREAKTLEQCDSILVPHDAFHFNQYPDYLKYLNQLSEKKPIILSDRGDFPKKPKVNNSIALRVAINPGESTKNKIVVPYNVESLNYLPLRKYSSSPVVSFVGFMPRISPRRVIKTARQSPLHPIQGNGAIIRYLSHKALVKSGLEYRFTLRSSYGAIETSNIHDTRSEYLEGMSESDYVASPRGDANQSARFYETLSAGRIPLVLDSSMCGVNSLTENSKNICLGLIVPTLNSCIHQNVMKNWMIMSSSGSYSKKQLEIREYYDKNLRFTRFMKRMFDMNFSDFVLCAK
jgi:hypothetical protein